MIKKIIVLVFIFAAYFLSVTLVTAADIPPLQPCDPKRIEAGTDRCVDANGIPSGYSCYSRIDPVTKRVVGDFCQRDVFGQVQAPEAIKNLGFGSAGISKFLNNLITLIYMIASVVFVFMILWGALEWLTSGGNKDNLDNARKRITQAIIGIILFGIAFALMSLVGVFTGFTFFWDKSATGCGPTAIETTYFDDRPGINQCIHKVFDNNCQPVFIKVENRFCGR